ncbi:hypothetical protein PIB30_071942 [Stylosanthes scabra]|uniref:Uncharacterized protein n=1 Tax=Stylosanthes scabra TaxID=79078 RepID=A0ABU6RPE4_9FABA|nr:hypothetical protein [Stylosanthes scabra]
MSQPDSFVNLWFTFKNLPGTQKTEARELVASHNSAYNKVLGRPTMYKVGASMTTFIHTRKFITNKDEDEALEKARSEAKKCHIATRHDSKDQLPKPEMAGRIYLADLEPPGRKMPEETQPPRKLKKLTRRRKSRHARNRPKFLQTTSGLSSRKQTGSTKAKRRMNPKKPLSKGASLEPTKVGIITGDAKPKSDGRQHSQDS